MKKLLLTAALLTLAACLLLTGCHKVPQGASTTTAPKEDVTALTETTDGPTKAIVDAAGETVLQLPDENHGISILSKTSPVLRGNSVNIVIMGQPDHEYSITFTLDGKETALKGEAVRGSDVGIATWNLEVAKDLATGVYEATVRDTADGSEDYVITHIEVK